MMQKNKAFLMKLVIFVVILILGVLGYLQYNDRNENERQRAYETFMQTQKDYEDYSVRVLTATSERDGVHFEGGGPESLAWGPKTFLVEEDGSVWIDDTPAMRRIHVSQEGEIIEIESYEYGEQPREFFADEQELSSEQQVISDLLSESPVYEGFSVSEVYYWGTSPEGYQYWQTGEIRQDEEGVLLVHAFIGVIDESGAFVAMTELPIETQYTYVNQNGVFVDPELNSVYFMTTLSGGVMVDSVGWSL